MERRIELIAAFGLFLSLTACGAEAVQEPEAAMTDEKGEPEISEGIPVSWILHEGDKYVFTEIVPKEDIDMEQVLFTGAMTDEGDGIEWGKDILRYEKDGSLFVVDDAGLTEEWAKFMPEN